MIYNHPIGSFFSPYILPIGLTFVAGNFRFCWNIFLKSIFGALLLNCQCFLLGLSSTPRGVSEDVQDAGHGAQFLPFFFPTIPSGGENLLIQFRVFWQMARGHSSWSICHWLSSSLCPGWDCRKSVCVLCNHAARGGNHGGTECCYMECCCHQKTCPAMATRHHGYFRPDYKPLFSAIILGKLGMMFFVRVKLEILSPPK